MKQIFIVLQFIILSNFIVTAQKTDKEFITPFERTNGKQTATYNEAITFYKQLSKKYKSVSIQSIGKSDGGHDMYVVNFHTNSNVIVTDYTFWDKSKDVVILINNAIHPGEPDGVDACMMLVRDAAMGKIKYPEHVVLAIIPVYNVGGALNRNGTSRANQNGPELYGFRGNAKNLDLNRDFIKQDANETKYLEKLFYYLDPDIFIDNHVSDGADYKHVMTLLATQHNKLGGAVGEYQHKNLVPAIFKDMKQRGFDMVPYVNDFDNTPENGWREFYDPPRFSSGYASLFQTFAFVPETHMLKPFKDRVEATYALMLSFINIASTQWKEIKAARQKDKSDLLVQKIFPLDWSVDTTVCDSVLFMGYKAGYKPSKVSGLPRLYYDHDKPYTKNVAYYNHYVQKNYVTAPKAYIIPQTWNKVLNILFDKHVKAVQLKCDTSITVTTYHIDNYETVPRPYESHYMHKNVQVTANKKEMKFFKGDYLIPINQPLKRYLIETLEPTAPDAFFAWNFFDGILQQKEYYSDYVFEDLAANILEQDTLLKNQLDTKRKQEPQFAKDGAAQLDFVYRHSKYMEPEYMVYPVYRIEE